MEASNEESLATGEGAATAGPAGSAQPEPHVLEAAEGEPRPAKQRVMAVLGLLDLLSKSLRQEALRLAEEEDALHDGLGALLHADIVSDLEEGERDDVQEYVERIAGCVQTVHVEVMTHRDQTQEEALHQVNLLIDSLVVGFRADPLGTRKRCLAYMSACTEHYVQGGADQSFEHALLGCALDDQKRVGKRLSGLLSYFDKMKGYVLIEQVNKRHNHSCSEA